MHYAFFPPAAKYWRKEDMLMLRLAHFECNQVFGRNDFMSGFCTAPENTVYWALS